MDPALAPGAHVSTRWAEWRAALTIEDYERRFASIDASGSTAHGEAELIASYAPVSVLDAGCGTGRVAIELARRGITVVGVDLDDEMLVAALAKAPGITWIAADLAAFDLGRRFDVVAMPGNVMIFCKPGDRAAIVTRCAAHLVPGGRLVSGFGLERRPEAITLDEYDSACAAAGLALVQRFATWEGAPYVGGDYAVSVHRIGSHR